MPTFQHGVEHDYNIDHEVKCAHCAKVFVIFTCITILDLIFIIGCSFVYLKEFMFTVRKTYNPTTNMYEISRTFALLYLWESICALAITLWIIFFIVWLLYNVFND